MFAYLRKRNLGCEQLEGRFAPSSVLVGAGGRSTFKDAQALDTTQAEQAAFYLAASAVMSQSSSVANVAPITFDQPAAGEAEGSQDSANGGYRSPGFPMNCEPRLVWDMQSRLCILIYRGSTEPQPADDWTESDGQSTGDTEVAHDIPSVEPVSLETPSGESNDAEPVGAMPSEELPAGGDDVAAEDFPLVVDDTLVAGDEAAHPVGEDTGVPDPSNTEELPRCGNDFEDLGPIDPVGTDTEITDATGSDEIDLDAVPVEPQFEDAADEVAPVDA